MKLSEFKKDKAKHSGRKYPTGVLPKEIKVCANCNKGEDRTGKPCLTRAGCFTPLYLNWEPIGEEKEDTGCPTCQHWAAVKIGKFCPDCAEKL